MTLRVLGRITSINVRKVLWAVDELGLSYEREDWGLPMRDPKVPDFLALNPNATVPVIVDGEFVLWESNAILRYLAEKHGRLLPDELEASAVVEQWLVWQVGELNPAWTYAVLALIRKNPAYTDALRIAESIGKWADKLKVLEQRLARSEFVAGDEFTIADIAIGVSSHRWFSAPIAERPVFPAVRAHYERMLARSAAKPWLSAETP